MKHIKRMKHRKLEPQAPKANPVYVTEKRESPESDAMPASAHWFTVTQGSKEGIYVVTSFVEYTNLAPEKHPGPDVIFNQRIDAESVEEASRMADSMLERWMEYNSRWDKCDNERISARKYTSDLAYTCSETGLTGFSMSKLVTAEAAITERIGGEDLFMDETVEDIVSDCGDEFGATYSEVRRSLFDHLKSHPECNEVYERLKAKELSDLAEHLKGE